MNAHRSRPKPAQRGCPDESGQTRPAAQRGPMHVPARFFVLRTPLLPFDELSGWSAGLRAPAAGDGPGLAAAWAADRVTLRERLRALVTRPAVRDALFVASPSLDESLGVWLNDPESELGQKVERTLARYLQRMASRATPFGLFAGCSVGAIGESTRLVVAGRDHYRRHARLDSDYLEALTQALGRDPAVRRTLTYRPNSSLYRLAGRYRWVRTTAIAGPLHKAGSQRVHHLAATDGSDHLDATLACAAGGARADELAQALVSDEIAREEATAFVDQLIESQMLTSDLTPLVTGREPIHDVIGQLAAHPETRPVAATLASARATLAQLDEAPLGGAAAEYRALAATLQTLPVAPELNRMLQIDMVTPAAEAELGPEVLRAIEVGVRLLQRLSAHKPNDALVAFREAFVARYEEQELPLAEVLDEEHGIGFDRPDGAAQAAPLLDGLVFPGAPVYDAAATWSPRQQHLLRKVEQALRSDEHEIVLDDDDLARLERKDQPRLPDSFAVMATIGAASPDALAGGDFRVWLQYLTGPSSANLLGRFCHGDERLTGHVRDCLRAEEALRPYAIFAEIVHLPEGRMGNVILRPLLRQYEIPFLGRSGAPRERQLPVGDLLVSVRDGRVVLRSRQLDREVIPRLTSMHNHAPATNLGGYRLLCALSQQDGGRLAFDWGTVGNASFLPRLRAGRMVLSLASWRLYDDELAPLGKSAGVERWRRAQALRQARRLPRWVTVSDGDHQLPVDFDNPLSVETFAELVGQRRSLTLTEIFDVDGACVRGPEGRFRHELVVPFTRQAPAAAAEPTRPNERATPERIRVAPRPDPIDRSAVARRLAAGSEWLYLKLYTGPATIDAVLGALAPAIAGLLASAAADSWFFVRYVDPDWHLRVRVHGEPARLSRETGPALTAVAQQLLDGGQIRKLQLDTYEREIERYGGDDGILLAEQLFFADSEAAAGIVELLSPDEGAGARWRLALRGMDMLLDDLGYAFDDKRAILRACRDSFGREHHAEGALARQIGDKFRKERTALEELLDPSRDGGSALEPGFELLAQRSQRLRPIGDQLRALAAAGRLTRRLDELAPSYLHMHANRLLQSAARAQELVLYDFLDRLYEGMAVRRRQAERRRTASR